MREHLGLPQMPTDNEHDELLEDPLDNDVYNGLYNKIANSNRDILEKVYEFKL